MTTQTLTFSGLVQAHEFAEDSMDGATVLIGGVDVVCAVDEAESTIACPATAAVTIGAEAPISGALSIDPGFRGCCEMDGPEPSEFRVGEEDVLHILNRYDGQELAVTVTLAGWVPPPPVIVTVESAQHMTLADDTRVRPLDILELEKGHAQHLALEGGITRESAAAAGLRVPEGFPELVSA